MDAKNIKLTLLNLPGWGSVSASKIFMEYSAENLTDPDSMLDAIKELASKQKRIKIPSISEIQQAFLQAESIQNNCLKANIQILTEEEANYPIRLKNQDKKPLVLYAKGNSTLINDDKIFALIGTREPNDWIYKSMKRIGYRCAENNIHVLSGLALGCDTAAHQGCLDAGGKAIAVLGNGLDTIYPKKNQNLADTILATGGCLISEYEPGKSISKFQLVARDKLQSSLSDSVIVGQTSIDGGSMHAANYSMDKLNRPVAVLSGDICHGDSFSGNHDLLNRGAKALSNAQDVQGFIGVSEKKLQAVLFDLDQTLVDSSQLEPMRKSRDWKTVLSHLHLVEPVKGVNEYLNFLKERGLKTGLVTSSPRHYATAICQKYGWEFDVIVAYHDTSKHKPHPEPLIKAANQLSTNKESCVYVGDDEKDCQAAVASRMKFIQFLATESTDNLEFYLKNRIEEAYLD